MGCALEIGWVNKERGAVSFTWLILLTILFALSESLSHAPFLILYFSHATYTSPPAPILLSHLHSLPLYLLSLCPLFCPFASLSRRIHLICGHYFQSQKCPSAAYWRALSHSVFSALSVLIPSCGISRFIFLLVRIIAPAWYEILHWLHRFKPQSVALFSWSWFINKQTCTQATMFTNS